MSTIKEWQENVEYLTTHWYTNLAKKAHIEIRPLNTRLLTFIVKSCQEKSCSCIANCLSFTVKNDNIHSFFSLVWLQILNLPASLQNKNTLVGPFPWKRSVLQNPDRERTNQSTGIYLRLGLPYNKYIYIFIYIFFFSNKNQSGYELLNREMNHER